MIAEARETLKKIKHRYYNTQYKERKKTAIGDKFEDIEKIENATNFCQAKTFDSKNHDENNTICTRKNNGFEFSPVAQCVVSNSNSIQDMSPLVRNLQNQNKLSHQDYITRNPNNNKLPNTASKSVMLSKEDSSQSIAHKEFKPRIITVDYETLKKMKLVKYNPKDKNSTRD